MAAARLPHHRRDGRPQRVPRDARRARSLEGAGRRPVGHPLPARRSSPASAATAPMAQNHGLEAEFDDTTLLPLCQPALERGEPVRGRAADPQRQPRGRHPPRQRGHPALRAPHGLPDDTIQLHFRGSAGQSFVAFVPRGITLTLEGDANDYVGKGLSGGKLVVYPPRRLDLPRRGERHHRQRGLLRRHRRRGLHPGHGRRALLRAQQRRQRGGRGGGGPRLRIHDRRPGGRAGRHRAQLRAPACRAASPTCWTRAGSSSSSCNKEMVGLAHAGGPRGDRGGAGHDPPARAMPPAAAGPTRSCGDWPR